MKGKEEIVAITSSGRPACAFYGFALAWGAQAMVNQHGNQCAIASNRGAYRPCLMEVKGQTPAWSACPLNTEKNREAIRASGILESVRVYHGSPPTQAVTLKSWFRHVHDGVPLSEAEL